MLAKNVLITKLNSNHKRGKGVGMMQNCTHQRFPPRASTEHALWTQTLSSQKVTRKSHVRRQRQSLGDLLQRKKNPCKAQNPTSQRTQSIPMRSIYLVYRINGEFYYIDALLLVANIVDYWEKCKTQI